MAPRTMELEHHRLWHRREQRESRSTGIGIFLHKGLQRIN